MAWAKRLGGVLRVVAVAGALYACGSDDDGAQPADGEDFFNAGGSSSTGGAPSRPPSAGTPAGGSGGRVGGAAGSSTAGSGGGTGAGSDAGGSAGDAAPDAGSAMSGSGGSSGGSGGSGGSTGTPGGPMGTQPLGKVCTLDSHCSQETGEAVCCDQACTLVQDCPESPMFLPCNTGNDCKQFGGGKVCCSLGAQRFCTKPSGCTGQVIP